MTKLSFSERLALKEPQQWDELFEFIEPITNAESFGQISEAEKSSSGITLMPRIQYTNLAISFANFVQGFIPAFDYMNWEDGTYILQQEAIYPEKYSVETLSKLLKFMTMKEKFIDGSLLLYLHKGYILGILSELKVKVLSVSRYSFY